MPSGFHPSSNNAFAGSNGNNGTHKSQALLNANTLANSLNNGGTLSRRSVNVPGLRFNLPVDDDDYLMPSPQSPLHGMAQPPGSGGGGPNSHHHHGVTTPTNNNVNSAYMDLISDPAGGGNNNKGSNSGSSSSQNGGSSSATAATTMFPYPPPQGYFLTGNIKYCLV